MGILLFGIEKFKFQNVGDGWSGFGYLYCYFFMDFDIFVVEDVKIFKVFVEEGEDDDEVLIVFKELVFMVNVLFCVN